MDQNPMKQGVKIHERNGSDIVIRTSLNEPKKFLRTSKKLKDL